jgi:8-amino-7-oxononanoate synthase
VPILTGDEERTVAIWNRLLNAGLYVNVILPPGCPQDECVLRASCSAAHTHEQITRALGIFAEVDAGVTIAGGVG